MVAVCKKKYLAYLLLSSGLFANASAVELSGSISAEYRNFTQQALYPQQEGNSLSGAAQISLVHEWNDGDQIFAFVPFVRRDQHDDERSHADIRELTWVNVADDWELRLGIRKVFWGVTESQHLVDIINQTDLVESADGEEKLGQPMLNLALIRDWGTVDMFILPYFRERTFPGASGRLRTPLPIDATQAQYASDDKQRHIDYALRWSHYIGDLDIGLSYFNGTSRAPGFINTGTTLIPFYDQIRQWGLDLQATKESWLWKLEAIQHSGTMPVNDYKAATGGFEYSFYSLFGNSDLGLVMEYLYDDRGNSAPTPFQDDLMLGMRWAMNDEQSTEALLGVITDLDTNGHVYSLEASRRLGEDWKVNLEGRFYQPKEATDPLYIYRNEDNIQLELNYYF